MKSLFKRMAMVLAAITVTLSLAPTWTLAKDELIEGIFPSWSLQSDGARVGIGATAPELTPRLAAQSAAHTRDEAVAWVNAQAYAGTVFGDGQCVWLTYYYYQYLGQAGPYGDAKDYANGSAQYVPSGWTYQSSPQPGDIAVWTYEPNGHVAIVTEIRGSQMVCVEQNNPVRTYYCTANLHNINAQTYIRPDWPSTNRDPYGFFDGGNGGNGNSLRVYGWVYDPDSPSTPVSLHVYVGGPAGSGASCYTADAFGNPLKASQNRSDVGPYGFDYSLIVRESGPQDVYVYAINNEGGNNPLLTGGPKTMTILANAELADLGESFYARLNPASGKTLVRSGDNAAIGTSGPSSRGFDIWHFTRNADKSYTIASTVDGKVLGVAGGTDADGTNIGFFPAAGIGEQARRFFIGRYTSGNHVGRYYLRPACSTSRLMDVAFGGTADGTNIRLHARNDSAAQSFAISEVPELVNDGDFTARIVNRANGTPIVRDDSGNVVVGSATSSETVALWRFEYDTAKGCYHVCVPSDNRCLDVYNALDANGTNVWVRARNGNAAQDWYLFRNADGGVMLRPGMSNGSLDVDAGKATAGTNVQIWGTAEWWNGPQTFILQTASATVAPTVSYRTHVEDHGWQDFVANGTMSGTSGEAKRLEGIEVKLAGMGVSGSVEYRTHIQDFGWEDAWRRDGQMSGTSGQAKRLEAIQIRLTDAAATRYDLWYRVHAENVGWMGWAKNGAQAGTAAHGYRLEAIEIKLVAKGGAAPGATSAAYLDGAGPLSGVPDVESLVLYRTHVQNVGWQNWMRDGEMAGTSGKAYRLEGIEISLGGAVGVSGSVEYRTHIQDFGWEDAWRRDGQTSGTSGQAKRLEAIQIRLTGDVAVRYDVWYRVHAEEFGWMGWAKDGTSAGTAGYGRRLEAIEVVLVAKGGAAPVRTDTSTQAAYVENQNPAAHAAYESIVEGLAAQSAGRFARYCYLDGYGDNTDELLVVTNSPNVMRVYTYGSGKAQLMLDERFDRLDEYWASFYKQTGTFVFGDVQLDTFPQRYHDWTTRYYVASGDTYQKVASSSRDAYGAGGSASYWSHAGNSSSSITVSQYDAIVSELSKGTCAETGGEQFSIWQVMRV